LRKKKERQNTRAQERQDYGSETRRKKVVKTRGREQTE